MSRPPWSHVAWLLPVACIAGAPLATALVLAFGPDPREARAALPLHAPDGDYVGAATCRPCHLDRFTSWRRTYHASMTQLPNRVTVLGRFDDVPVTAFGATATPFQRDGRFFFRLPASGASGPREAEIALCVGSRRYQQYFERRENENEPGQTYQRLPLLWHVGEGRWMHLNGVFLEPDSDNWNAHRSTWNANCIFCHNTGVVPGLVQPPPSTQSPESAQPARRPGEPTFDSRVTDLGIACESCHGPGGEHARHNRSPIVRYIAELGRTSLTDIVDPFHLAQAESLALCGQCHSQRLPDPPQKIWDYLRTGPSFRPGDRLDGHVVPLTRDTPVPDPNQPDGVFRDRFWSDGTARLTAYEYLGVTQSPCFKGGSFSCSSCHTMHGGDVAGQIEPAMRGDRACTQCHLDVARNVAGHTHHLATSSGSRCLECHMPRMVYGVLSIHRSHRVESPDVGRDVEGGRPNACTACHLDRDALWAADRMRELWGAGTRRPRFRPDHAPLEIPEALASLHAGDPVQRAVYYAQLGRTDGAIVPQQRGFVLAHALVGLGDGYGAIRTLARQSALVLDGGLGLGLHDRLQAFDVQAPRAQRDRELSVLLRAFETTARTSLGPPPAGKLLRTDYALDLQQLRALLGQQAGHAISIGE
jgi:predicted CXXCH cytochrome family protein